MSETKPAAAAKPLLKIDKAAKSRFEPYRTTPLVRALDTAGQVADQLQLRLVCSGVIAAGVVRGDGKLAFTGLRMLAAHELANAVKSAVKRRVDRTRPRSTAGRHAARPHKGRSRDKEQQSFPSGHSAGAVAVASALGAAYPAARVPALAAAGSIAAVRIVACAHYPSDVAAGATIGGVSERALTWAGRATRALAGRVLRW